MFSILSSRQQQQESERARRETIRKGIKFILSHFKKPIFPRIIASRSTTYDGPQIKVVYNEKEIFRTYEQSKFIDCTVSMYRSSYATEEYHNDENLKLQMADLIIINVCKPIFIRESAQIKALYAILQAIKKILSGKPTILWSTGSFYIYQPIESHTSGQIKEFIDYIIRQILGFPEQLYNPSMLLIPGTFDSKNVEKRKDEEIMLIQKWDGYRPRIVSPIFDSPLRPYIRYEHQAESKAFLICKSCFWCASYLNIRNVINKCPVCDNDSLLNSIPISDKEVYEIYSSQKVELTSRARTEKCLSPL